MDAQANYKSVRCKICSYQRFERADLSLALICADMAGTMVALAVLAKQALAAVALQQPNTEAQYEIINASRDGRLIILAIAILIVVMLFKQLKAR
ncbi:MAG TPA: hypothetical protein VES67_00870 [Vicinamibacterales bacterium]|nr:hypothetical protein [Vicinamibacterales bacterium]